MPPQRATNSLEVARKDAEVRDALGMAKNAALAMDTNEIIFQQAVTESVCCNIAPDNPLRLRLLQLVLHLV